MAPLRSPWAAAALTLAVRGFGGHHLGRRFIAWHLIRVLFGTPGGWVALAVVAALLVAFFVRRRRGLRY